MSGVCQRGSITRNTLIVIPSYVTAGDSDDVRMSGLREPTSCIKAERYIGTPARVSARI
jgi:hypothetical protein